MLQQRRFVACGDYVVDFAAAVFESAASRVQEVEQAGRREALRGVCPQQDVGRMRRRSPRRLLRRALSLTPRLQHTDSA